MENDKVLAEVGAAGERQSVADTVTFAAVRAYDQRPGHSKLERMRDALEAILPTREQIADALHAAREGEMGCERKDPRQCLYWHEEAERADVMLALLTGDAK